MLETAGIDISIYKSHSARAAGWSNVQIFATFYDKPIYAARTTSDVLFNMTPTNVVTDGLWNLIGFLMQLPCSRICILCENYLRRSPKYYSARVSTAYGSRCPPWGRTQDLPQTGSTAADGMSAVRRSIGGQNHQSQKAEVSVNRSMVAALTLTAAPLRICKSYTCGSIPHEEAAITCSTLLCLLAPNILLNL